MEEEIKVSEIGSNVVRFGILGCASVAKKLIRALHMVSGVEAYAVASRSLAKARAFAHATGMKDGHCCYGSYEDLIDDPLVDVIYVPIPSGLHLDWVLRIAAKGKHILLEKPVSVELQEFDQMVEACGKAGVQLMDGTMWMHHPRTQAVKRLVEDKKKFGDVVSICAALSMFRITDVFHTNNIRSQKHLDGLGALGGHGWYCVRAMLWVMDYDLPKEVRAWPNAVLNEQGVIMQFGANLFWENGVAGSVESSFMAGWRDTLEISGTNALVSVRDFVMPESEESASYEVRRMANGAEFWEKFLDIETFKVASVLPQEALMVQEMGRLVRNLQNGIGVVDTKWTEISWKTQLVLNAIDESIKLGGSTVAVKGRKHFPSFLTAAVPTGNRHLQTA